MSAILGLADRYDPHRVFAISAMSADFSPPDQVASLMTLQTALGFALTFHTVQMAPALASGFGWPLVLGSLAIGPVLGIIAMLRLRAMG